MSSDVESQFDMSTYWGRLMHFTVTTDMRMLFTSRAQLELAGRTVREYEQRRTGALPVSAEDRAKYFHARNVRAACLHPETGELIAWPLRFSAFVPVNVVLVAAMTLLPPTTPYLVFGQWLNQSYNVFLNHANRNASNAMSAADIAKAYVAAVSVSCSVALGLNHAVKRTTALPPRARAFAQLAVPYAAVTTAAVANVLLMRANELSAGIQVRDADGQLLGSSKAAARTALSQVAIVRGVSPVPGMLMAPLVIRYLANNVPVIQRSPAVAMAANLGVIALALQLGLPTTMAFFPPQATLPVADVEEQFRNLKRANGEPVTHVFFNKGL